MKLKRIELEAFRAFGETKSLDLDADVILLLGRNGSGKTSVFDALSWCLFGTSKRFEGSRDFSRAGASYVTNAFRTNGDERIRVELTSDREDLIVERRGGSLSFFDGSTELAGARAQEALLQPLGFDRSPDETVTAFAKRARDDFARSFLLYQDFMADFIRAATPRERFDAFADLFSLTPIRDFYEHMTSERAKARELLEAANREREIGRAELSQLERHQVVSQERIDALVQSTGDVTSSETDYSARLISLVSQVAEYDPAFPGATSEREPIDLADAGILALTRLEGATQEEKERLELVLSRLPRLSGWRKESSSVSAELAAADEDVAALGANAAAIQLRVDSARESALGIASKIEQTREQRNRTETFLAEAVEHVLGDMCPVCEREIDRTTLLQRLRTRLEGTDPEIPALLERRRSIEEELQGANETLKAAQETHEQATEHRSALAAKADQLLESINAANELMAAELEEEGSDGAEDVLNRRVRALQDRATGIQELLDSIRRLRPYAELISARADFVGLKEDVRVKSLQVMEREARLSSYGKVAQHFDGLISSARKAERAVLQDFIGRFREPIQAAYKWLSPHPLFSSIDIDLGDLDQAGELYFEVSEGDVKLNPATAFSAGQANALAAIIFLSLNVGQDWSPLRIVLIDDLIQNLDDINILRLVDFTRNLAGGRQLVLSTSVPHVYELLTDKFRPTKAGGRLIAYQFTALTATGPDIQKEVYEYKETARALPRLTEISA